MKETIKWESKANVMVGWYELFQMDEDGNIEKNVLKILNLDWWVKSVGIFYLFTIFQYYFVDTYLYLIIWCIYYLATLVN